MEERPLFSRFRDSLGHSPVMTNMIFAFLMAVAEEILGAEFTCPCNPTWNRLFAAAFFVLPAFTAFLLMMVIYRCGRQNDDSNKCWSCLTPPLVWQVILFCDGQYFVCAMTDWSGKFYSVDNTYLKWCEPTNGTESEELKALSGKYFVLSQVIGFGLIMLLTLILAVYVSMKCKKKMDTN